MFPQPQPQQQPQPEVFASPSMMLAVVGAVLGLVALNTILLFTDCCRKVREPTVYEKVEMVSPSEVDEEEPMM